MSAVSLLVFNIIVYIILSVAIFTSILIILDKSFSTLNKLKQLQQYYFLFVFVLLFLLSLAGVPPLLGFVGKFLLYIQLLAYKSYLLFTIFLLFNVVVLYFYIQNIRFMVAKNTNISIITNSLTSLINEEVLLFLLLIMFFNLLGICYFENFLIYLNY